MKIKFRAWDKKNNKWYRHNPRAYKEYLCVCDDVVVVVEYKPNNSGGYSPFAMYQLTNPEVDNLKLMQFTGLQDKNKKEIYSGDIIRMAYHGISEVFFRNGGYKINGKLSVVGFGSQAKYSEIIGNKFTTPELINN